MKIRASTYFLFFILVLATIFFVNSYTMETIRMKLVPLVVSLFVIVLAMVELAKELIIANRTTGKLPQEKVISEKEGKAEMKKYAIGFSWLVFLFLGILFFGFIGGIAIFIFAFLKLNNIKWIESIMMTGIASLIIYGVFVGLLKSDLFPGIFFGGHW